MSSLFPPSANNQGPVDCNPERPGYVAIYFHSAAAQASGNSKRRLLAERARRAEAKTACPRGLTACKIPGSDDGFEVRRNMLSFSLFLSCRRLKMTDRIRSQCLDIMTELESCGGCRHGVYQPATPNDRIASPL